MDKECNRKAEDAEEYYEDVKLDGDALHGCIWLVGILVMIAMVVSCFIFLVGCKQVEYMPVVSTNTDTLFVHKTDRDSVWIKDSVYIREKGDTVWMERWKTMYREKLKTDTLIHTRIDTIRQPVIVEKVKVVKETKYTWWLGLIGMAVGAVGMAWLVRKVDRRTN